MDGTNRPDETETRLRMALHETEPEPLDAGTIIAGARRRRVQQRLRLAAGAAGVVVLVGGIGGGMSVLRERDAGSAAAPAERARSSPAESSTAADRASTAAPGGPAAAAPVALVDGVAVEARATGFCVRGTAPAPVCHEGAGSVVVDGRTRRWLVFVGPDVAGGYAYLGAGGAWVPMERRAEPVAAGRAAAYAADPPGAGPFRVRTQGPGEPRVWTG